MKKTKTLKISTLSVCAVLCLGFGIAIGATEQPARDISASAAATAYADSLIMQRGASVRINKTDDHTDNGIRFTANISDADYEYVCKLTNAQFGMFIMPASYVTRFGDLTAENVDVNGVYDWKENGSETFFYGGDSVQYNSHQIISVVYDTLEDDPDKDGYKIIRGSVADIKDKNLDMDYIGRAFVRYESDDGYYFYEMAKWYEDCADNSVRSVVEVTEKALADENSGLSDTQKKALSTGYIERNLTYNGATAISSAEGFAAMTANGKYYLADDITISSSYTAAFSGVLDGNGKTITCTSPLFTNFSGTLQNVSVNATGASVVTAMNGGKIENLSLSSDKPLVDELNGGTVQFCTLSVTAAAEYAVARTSGITAWVDNNVVYAPTENFPVFGGSANVTHNTYSNYISKNAADKYYKVTYVSARGEEVVRVIKEGDDISNDKLRKAGSVFGTVNAWNKESSTAKGDVTYFATDVEYIHDADKAWEKIADSPLVNATEVGGEIPSGYTKVSVNSTAMNTKGTYFADIDVSGYTDLRFAYKVSSSLLMSDWNLYMSDGYEWVYVALSKTDDGWTLSMNQKTNTDAAGTSYTLTGNTLQSIFTKWYLGNPETSKIWITDIYGVKAPIWGETIEGAGVDGFAEATDKATPAGFDKAYYKAGVETGTKFTETDISGYEEIRFYVALPSGYFNINGWGAYAENSGFGTDWHLVSLVNDGENNWTITVNAKLSGDNVTDETKYTYTASGSTLKAVLNNWFSFVGGTPNVYITELRGEKAEATQPTVWGATIEGAGVDGFAETTDKATPTGFEKAYYKEKVPAGTTFTETDISGYEEIRFYMSVTDGYVNINGWGAYADHSGFGDDWHLITLTNGGNGNWTIKLDVQLAGQSTSPYTYTVTGNTLKAVLSSWFSFADGTVYLTDLRGVRAASEPWNTSIAEIPLVGATVDETKFAPDGFERVNAITLYNNANNTSFVNANLRNYSEVRFAFRFSGYGFFLFNGWTTYATQQNTWYTVKLVNDENNAWTVTVDGANIAGGTTATSYTYKKTGETLGEILCGGSENVFFKHQTGYPDADTVMEITELRGLKKATPNAGISRTPAMAQQQKDPVIWGEQAASSALQNATATTDVAVPVGYTAVSHVTALAKNAFAETDISAYTELRFAIKAPSKQGWILLSGWNYYMQAPDEWISVTLKKTVDGKWDVTASTEISHSLGDGVFESLFPYTFTYEGDTLKALLANWYNDAGEVDFYVTDLRGEKNALYTTTELSFMTGATETTETAPTGFDKVYSTTTCSIADTTDISSYSELHFAFKDGGYFLIDNSTGKWEVYATTDWVNVTLHNNCDGTWQIVYEGTKSDGTGVIYVNIATNGYAAGWHSRYEVTGNGSTLQAIYTGVNPYLNDTVFTEIIATVLPESNAEGLTIGNLAFTTLYETADETAPTPYDDVYLKTGLSTGDFAATDISEYAEVHFSIKTSSVVKCDESGTKTIGGSDAWIAIKLVNGGNGESWNAYADGTLIGACSGKTLQAALAAWHCDDANALLYVTELRGVAGGYTIDKVHAIAMSEKDGAIKANVTAVRELVAQIKALTGKELLVEYYGDARMLDPERRYIVLGDLAKQLGATATDLTAETGYKIDRIGNNVYLLGNSEIGNLNAVYGFLNAYYGLKYYTNDVYTHDDNPETAKIGMKDAITFNPSVEYNWIVDGIADDADAYAKHSGMVNLGLGGGGWHNFLTVVSEDTYGESHSEWFVTRDGAKTLDITTEANREGIATVVAEAFAAELAENSLTRYQFSAPDFTDTSFTTSDYVKLMNKIAEKLDAQISREVELIILAYNSTIAAPTGVALVDQTNVKLSVMFAPVEYNYYYDFTNTTSYKDDTTKTNAWFYTQMQAWNDLIGGGKLYFWNYSVFYDNYFVPLDTITNMQSKYQAAIAAGASVIYDLGEYKLGTNAEVGTDWAALKLYLKAELGKNVNADVDALIDEFMTAYYGAAAAPYMKQLLTAQQTQYKAIAASVPAGNVVRSYLFDKSLWGGNKNDMLVTWYGYIQSALNATTDETLRNRIHAEGLTIRYLNYAVYSETELLNSDKVKNVADFDVICVGGTTTEKDNLSKIIEDAKALGIERFAEGYGWICYDGTSLKKENLVEGVIDNLA